MPFTQAGELTVHYEFQGAAGGAVVLLVNSLGTDLRIWDPQAAALASRYRVLRYDKRGHGLTDGPAAPQGYTIDQLAGDALALLDALGVDRVHACGLSIGGMISQRLATKAPDRIQSLALCDTAARIGPPALWEERIGAIRKGGLEAVVDGVMARWFTERFHKERPADLRGCRNMLLRTSVDGYLGCCIAIRDADLRDKATSIRCPTLVVVGTEDAATPPALAEELCSLIEGARLATIEGAAHIPTVETPEALNGILGEFLSQAAPGEAAAAGDSFEAGMEVRKAVLGRAHVERASAAASDFDRDFQAFITRYAWGSIWTRPGLDRRTRSMLTIAMLAALGHEEELALHIRATRNTGVTREEMREILLQVAVYAGVPAANSAFRQAREIYQGMDKEGPTS